MIAGSKVSRTENLDVFCVCRLPDDGKRMVECSRCRERFHMLCACAEESYKEAKERKPWYCAQCRDTRV